MLFQTTPEQEQLRAKIHAFAEEEINLDTGEKQPAPPMVKMKRPPAPKPEPTGKRYVCGGCGYEYTPETSI